MKIVFEPGEVWWGGPSANCSCPLNDKSDYFEKLTDFSTSSSNQAMPFYVSSHGRYVWSDTPFDVRVKDGIMELTDGAPQLVKAGDTLKEAYLAAQKAHFPCNGRALPQKFFQSPQLNTWMEFTYYVHQEGVLEFAQKWIDEGFEPGVFMIDEGWQQRYGVWKFDPARFPDPKGMVEKLHAMGFKVLLWVVPYVSVDGPDYVRSLRPLIIGSDPEMAKHLYLRTETGDVALFSWWNGFSALLDMTDEFNRKFLHDQLKALMDDIGIDGFKFDGGSVAGYTENHVVNGKLQKKIGAHAFNQAWNAFGTAYEYHEYKDTYGRGGINSVQRLRDKGHRWDGDGLNTLIPCALTAGLTGYPFICPDMIGGGEWTYRFKPNFSVDEELFVRMAQCAALFPMMQFSWAPWNALSEENMRLCRDAADLHSRLAPEILALVNESVQTGEPIMRALEYVCPNCGYENITDEFMLGNDILVAPVLVKGMTEQRIVFPSGTWQDEEGNIYAGGTVQTVSAPLCRLNWFKRV